MKRLRLLLLMLTLSLVGFMALLTHRALAGLDVERSSRRRAAAEDLFTELERRLDVFIDEEERRPFDEYRHLLVPKGQVKGSVGLAKSPLADVPVLDFVTGYFQVDPDGTISTPLTPDDAGYTPPQPQVLSRDGEVRELAAAWLKTRPSSESPEEKTEETKPQQGYTLAAKQAADVPVEWNKKQRKGGMPRASRRDVASYESADHFQNLSNSSVSQRLKAVQSDEMEMQQLRIPVEPPPPESVEALLDPFVGRHLPPHHLVLHRNVVIGNALYRQGIILDTARLTSALARDALEGHEQAQHVQVHWGVGMPLQLEKDISLDRVFRHRLPEPFDDLHALALIGDLPEVAGTGYILGLWGVAVTVSLVGLFAVYRMASVQLSFAERRNNFVSAVTHELKTPLTAIRMHAEMLRDGMVASDEKRQQYHETITAESERLSRLVDNVLELSRLERGDRPVSIAAGDVTPVLREAMEILQPHANRLGFELQLDAESSLPAARFDRDALLQVILNLVENALKYARDAGTKQVALECRHQDGGICVRVRDSGPGVAPRHLSHVFEDFYRGENELTRRAKGTGIGLALVKG